MKNEEQVKLSIERFLDKKDFSLNAADGLVSAILHEFPNDQRFEEILDVLAQYRPGGGEFLYGEEKLQNECKRILKLLSNDNGCVGD